jgi:hypothetical protein
MLLDEYGQVGAPCTKPRDDSRCSFVKYGLGTGYASEMYGLSRERLGFNTDSSRMSDRKSDANSNCADWRSLMALAAPKSSGLFSFLSWMSKFLRERGSSRGSDRFLSSTQCFSCRKADGLCWQSPSRGLVYRHRQHSSAAVPLDGTLLCCRATVATRL